ncbi:MAG: hypothetical protein JSW67_12405 [Candidatus Latescibacterota bacterium]|nr:MAG: hypothetical protein JSW67_12405 [Candidatus Latescibacterota bacterium]
MSRVRGTFRRTTPIIALALLFSSGCIFSPETGEIPPPPPIVIDSPEKVIDALSRSYQERSPELFQALLANDADRNARYLFILSEPTELGETQWGWEEEVRVHKRMFRPESPDPGDQPVPPQFWLESVTITLTAQANFTERTDLYTTNGGDLDPTIWRARDARYNTNVFFGMAGETDFQVEGEANFVIIEDLTKAEDDFNGKFLLYIWEDFQTPAKAEAEPA